MDHDGICEARSVKLVRWNEYSIIVMRFVSFSFVFWAASCQSDDAGLEFSTTLNEGPCIVALSS